MFVLYETKSAVQLLATSYKYSIQEAGGTGINTLHVRTHGHCLMERTGKRRNQQDSVSSIIITIIIIVMMMMMIIIVILVVVINILCEKNTVYSCSSIWNYKQ